MELDNTDGPFGRHLKLSVRGASHAPCMSFRLENFPRGFAVDAAALAAFMERRAPGRDLLSTQRREDDRVEFAGGILDGVTTGEPICGTIANRDMRPGDYGMERTIPRPGHADFGQWVEQGRIPTGGGKNSGRLTAALCAAGGICKQWLERRGIFIVAGLRTVGGKTQNNDMLDAIEQARKDGDSVGGTIECGVSGIPAGLGGALFEGLETELSAAIFGIPGVKGLFFGLDSEAMVRMRGSEYNDDISISDGRVRISSERQGGILGGRTTGGPICFTVAMRPTPTVYKELPSVDLATMTPATLAMKGRHDPCIVRRAVPVVEAVTAFAIADAILADEAAHPRICLTLTGKTITEDIEQYKSQRYFADMVELRVDLLKKSERAKVATFLSMLVAVNAGTQLVPVILTFRKQCDGGAFAGDESERVKFFKSVLKRSVAGLAYVDFEEGFGDADLIELARAAGVKVIRSLHDFKGPVKNLPARLKKLASAGDIAKIAFMPKSLADVARLFRETADFTEVPHVVCAMGPLGFASRVLAGRTHSLWTYASVGGIGGEIGHVSPYELVRTYRFRSVTRAAALFGVTGWPLRATRSPELNNLAFADADQDAVMFPFPSASAKEAIAFFRAMNLRGMAVTIPHKQAVMPLLNRIDPAARRIGAVNTVVREGGKLVGYNTDEMGFGEAILDFVGKGDDLSGIRAAVLGAGGASKAVVHALKRLKAKVKVFHRETPPAGYDLIVNATPVDPIPDYAFTGRELVYDLVYVPAETPLIVRARAAGCRVENGFSMLIAQAAAQRRLYNGAGVL